jgi:hypothetical protein
MPLGDSSLTRSAPASCNLHGGDADQGSLEIVLSSYFFSAAICGGMGVARASYWALRHCPIADNQTLSQAGGLMSYAQDQNDLTRRAATYIDKILNGIKPADLPVEQAFKYELLLTSRRPRRSASRSRSVPTSRRRGDRIG